jgi:DNA-binding PadR family transcriptional regulator
MPEEVQVSYTTALILQTINAGYRYGFDMMDVTGLPSGTVYPALRRLEASGVISSKWEKEKQAFADQRPARKYYRLTRAGEEVLARAVKRYPLLDQMALETKDRRR